MRAKTLLCLAALAAGAATTMAQSNVYSLNIVGYVTYTQPANSLRIGANPLTTTNNDVSNIFTSAANYPGLTIHKRNNIGGYDSSTFDPDLLAWTLPLQVNPGDGVWIATPNNGTTFTNVYVGEAVLNSTNPIPAGYSIKGAALPQAGAIQTALQYPTGLGDAVHFWNGVGYDTYSFDPDLNAWTPSEPNVNVAQGFWIFNNGANKNWIRNFTVGP